MVTNFSKHWGSLNEALLRFEGMRTAGAAQWDR